MNRQDYRAAFDALGFSGDFESQTLRKLQQAAAQTAEKEKCHMKAHHIKKLFPAAAVAAALVVTISAAALLLTPAQVADALQNPVLADAFQGDTAVLLQEQQQVDGFDITLLGMVSGRGLSRLGDHLDADHTYVVMALAPIDGTPLDAETFDPFSWTATPLVSGCPVRAVNSWTLGTFAQCKVVNGTAYYILDLQTVEIFADRTVYLAVYPGGVPSEAQFSMADDGTLTLADPASGAMFVLPLDPALADPAAAQAFLDAQR